MSRTCGYCKGSGGRTRYYKSYGEQKEEWVPCKVCGGSGYDPNWRETYCKNESCRAVIEYNVRWTKIPEYCEECRKPQYKRCKHCNNWVEYKVWWSSPPEYCKECFTPKYKECKNPDCRHQFKYYVFWNNIPDYCRDCKGFREKPCKNPDCNGKVSYHNNWTNVQDYCKDCKGWRTKPCKSCGREVRYHNDWDYPPNICEECKKIRQERYSHEGAVMKANNTARRFGFKGAAGKRFHDWIEKHYGLEKDKFSQQDMDHAGEEFKSQDSPSWRD